MPDRLEQLRSMLSKSPRDAFLLYALSQEHKKRGETSEALARLREVIEVDPDYCYAYFQMGQIHQGLDDPAAARSAYSAGLAAAKRAGDSHAHAELTAAIETLP